MMNTLKVLVSAVLMMTLVSVAQAAPKAIGTENGFTVYEDGFMTMNANDYDPRDPNAAAMLDYMESIGEIVTIPDPLFIPVAAGGCDAKIYALVDKSKQTMSVYYNCESSPTYVWATSTGLTGPTPNYDTYASGRLGGRSNASGKYPGGCTVGGVYYGNMSNAVYLAANGNYAIHGGCEEELLGQPRSHGCIRIARANAKTFRDQVEGVIASYGKKAVRIKIIE